MTFIDLRTKVLLGVGTLLIIFLFQIIHNYSTGQSRGFIIYDMKKDPLVRLWFSQSYQAEQEQQWMMEEQEDYHRQAKDSYDRRPCLKICQSMARNPLSRQLML